MTPVMIICTALSTNHIKLHDYHKVELQDRPWHLAVATVAFRDDVPFNKFSMEFQLLDDLPSDGNELYLSPLCTKINSIRTYIGVTSSCFAASDREDTIFRVKSPGYRFVRFSKKSQQSAIRAKDGYICVSDKQGGQTGVCTKCTRKAGTYTIHMTAEKVENNEHDYKAIIDVKIISSDTMESTAVGQLYFFEYPVVMSSSMMSFAEVIQGWNSDKNRWHFADEEKSTTVPKLRMAIGNWIADEVPLVPLSLTAYYKVAVPQKCTVLSCSEMSKDEKMQLSKSLRRDSTLMLHLDDSITNRDLEVVKLNPSDSNKGALNSTAFYEMKYYMDDIIKK